MYIPQLTIAFILAISLLWTLFIIRVMNHWFSAKYNKLKNLRMSTYPRLSAFVREDRDNWNRVYLTIGAIFLLPIRFIMSVLIVSIGMIGNQIFVTIFGIENLNKEQHPLFIFVTRKWTQMIAKCLLVIVGYGSIKKRKIRLDVSKYPKLKQSKLDNSKASIIISNHVSIFDVVYYLSSNYTPSFVARSAVEKMPLIGAFAKVLQCIFVNRLVSQKDDVKELLETRVNNIHNGKNFKSVLIFPEGTCTNGKMLGQFKKGAFMFGSPLKIFFIKYNGMFDATLVNINELDSAIGILSDWSKSLEVYEVEGLIEPVKPMNWEEYAEAVRNLMAEEFNLGKCDATFAEKLELENKICGFTAADFQ